MKESLIEDWVAADPSLLGLDAMVIGRQVPTDQGKFIDLLAVDASEALIIIELKKDRTREKSWRRCWITPPGFVR